MEQRIDRCRAQDGRDIAYAVIGSGPPLVWPAWWTSNLELDWELPRFRGFMERLAHRHTVVRYDRPGVGASQAPRDTFTLAEETMYLQTVIDAVGIDRTAFVGMSCGAPPALALTATSPERVERIVVYGGYLRGCDIAPEATRRALPALVESSWGVASDTLAKIFVPQAEPTELDLFARYQRATATPSMAAALLRLTYEMDAAALAPLVSLPTLVLHRAGDRAIPLTAGQALAQALPDAELVVIEGRNHVPWEGDADSVLDEIERFLTGSPASPEPGRAMATIMFTDIVGSTELVAELGDRRWRSRLEEHDAQLRRHVHHHSGRIVNFTGDGALAIFDRASEALRCAKALRGDLGSSDLTVRIGVHTGEIEVREASVDGMAVHTAARIQTAAQPGEVLVSRTVREVTAGAGFSFEDRGEHDLKGLPEPVHVLALR